MESGFPFFSFVPYGRLVYWHLCWRRFALTTGHLIGVFSLQLLGASERICLAKSGFIKNENEAANRSHAVTYLP